MYRQVTYKGKTLCYQRSGAGAAVVLLHGFGEDGTVWDFQKVLAQQFTLLIPDLPGSGGSQPLADMSLEGVADAVHFILQEEGIEQCVLIGHSMGGYITLAFAQRHERYVQGFGLFHSSAYADSDEKVATRKKGIQFIKDHGAANFLKTSLPNLFSPATKETRPSLLTQQLETTPRFTNDTLIAYYEAMIQRPDRTDLLRKTAVPVLFVMGTHDTAVPLADGLAQCHLPQTAYIHVLRQSGHMGMLEEPERSHAILNEFLSATLS